MRSSTGFAAVSIVAVGAGLWWHFLSVYVSAGPELDVPAGTCTPQAHLVVLFTAVLSYSLVVTIVLCVRVHGRPRLADSRSRDGVSKVPKSPMELKVGHEQQLLQLQQANTEMQKQLDKRDALIEKLRLAQPTVTDSGSSTLVLSSGSDTGGSGAPGSFGRTGGCTGHYKSLSGRGIPLSDLSEMPGPESERHASQDQQLLRLQSTVTEMQKQLDERDALTAKLRLEAHPVIQDSGTVTLEPGSAQTPVSFGDLDALETRQSAALVLSSTTEVGAAHLSTVAGRQREVMVDQEQQLLRLQLANEQMQKQLDERDAVIAKLRLDAQTAVVNTGSATLVSSSAVESASPGVPGMPESFLAVNLIVPQIPQSSPLSSVSPLSSTTPVAAVFTEQELTLLRDELRLAEDNDREALLTRIDRATATVLRVRDVASASSSKDVRDPELSNDFDTLGVDLESVRQTLGTVTEMLCVAWKHTVHNDEGLIDCLVSLDGHIRVRCGYKSLCKGMYLVTHNDTIIEEHASVDLFRHGKQFALKTGVTLIFERTTHHDVIPVLQHLDTAVEEMFASITQLAISGPIQEQGGPWCAENPGDGGGNGNVLLAWRKRLDWDITVNRFKRDVWDELDAGAALYVETLVQPEAPTPAEPGGFVQGTGECNGKGRGKGKGAALLCKGKGKGKGKGAPPVGKGKHQGKRHGSGGPVVDGTDDAVDAVEKAAMDRFQKPLLGVKDRQLVNMDRSYATWVDVCSSRQEEDRVDIQGAFGGRGKLLLLACIPQKKKLQQKKKVASTSLLKLVSPMNNNLRSNYESMVRRLSPVDEEFRGRGLSLPPKDSSWRRTTEVARALASLDWPALREMDDGKPIQLDVMVPRMDIALHIKHPDVDETTEKPTDEQQQVINEIIKARQVFGGADDREALLKYEGPLAGLEKLERTLLPFLTGPPDALMCRFRILNIQRFLEEAAGELDEEIDLAIRAVSQMCSSQALQDMLSLMLQVTCYINSFGEAHQEGMGFLLTKIEGYASFSISKDYSFRKVLCAFLMNLRPGKRGPSFMDRLSKEELKDVREVVRRSQPLLEALRSPDARLETLPELLENRVAALQNLVPFVDDMMLQEERILGPFGDPSNSDAFAAELELRAKAREHMSRCRQLCGDTVARLEGRMPELSDSERRLKQFAGLKEAEVKGASVRYFQVMANVINFVDEVRKTWDEEESNPKLVAALYEVLLRVGPLQLVFSDDCLHDAFVLRSEKTIQEQRTHSKKHQLRWTRAKEESLASLFELFDSDRSGAVDAAEMGVVLSGMGFDVGGPCVELVKSNDLDGNGVITFDEFVRFVESRIARVFDKFGGSAEVISAENLFTVAEKYDVERDEEHLKSMIGLIDSGKDGFVSKEEFERLILQPLSGRQGKNALAPTDSCASPLKFVTNV